jgi:polyferredoxin
MRIRKTIVATFTTALLLALSTLGMAQDDEFEAVNTAPTAEATTTNTTATATSAPESANTAVVTSANEHEHHHHAAIPPLTWLNLGLSLAGVGLFFVRKFRYRNITLLFSVAVLGFYAGGCPCAVGASTKLFADIVNHNSALISGTLLAIAILPTLIFGRFFCGNACPIGALQEFLAPRTKFVSTSFQRERVLQRGQIVFFAILVFATFFTGSYFFEHIDPFRTVFNVRGNSLQVSVAVVVLLASLFVHRVFCRYLCPLAVFLNLAARFSLFKIKKPENCTNCKLCQKRCPISVIDESNEVNNAACIRCGECLDVCKFKDKRFSI